MTPRKRRVFDASRKLEVVRMIKEQRQSVQNVSETMSIGQTAIRRWQYRVRCWSRRPSWVYAWLVRYSAWASCRSSA